MILLFWVPGLKCWIFDLDLFSLKFKEGLAALVVRHDVLDIPDGREEVTAQTAKGAQDPGKEKDQGHSCSGAGPDQRAKKG